MKKTINVSYLRNNLKTALDKVYENNQVLTIARPKNENVVIISEEHYNELQKELHNTDYLVKLARSDKQISKEELQKVYL